MIITDNADLWNGVHHSNETSVSTDEKTMSVLHKGLLLIVEMDHGRNNIQVEALRQHSPKELINSLMDIFEALYQEGVEYVHIESFSKRRWAILDRLGALYEYKDGRHHRYFKLKEKYERC